MEAYFRVTQKQSGGGSGATITVTYSSSFYGKTMTCSDGVTTYTATTTSSGSTTFNVNAEGTWTITCDGASKTVNVVLSYATSLSITKTIAVYAAANDTVSFTDLTGSKTVTTDSTGAGSVSITYNDGDVIEFTSSVAKDPYDLTSYYSKQITMAAATTEIYVMPNDALYWYGYVDDNCETISTANGWTVAGSAGTPVYNTNSVRCTASSNQNTGIGNKNSVTVTKINTICQGVTAASGQYGQTGMSSDKNISSSASNYGATWYANSSPALVTYTPTVGNAGFIRAQAVNSRAVDISALWYINPNPAANFFSAANDTVYYISGGVNVVVAKTDEFGGAVVDLSSIPSGTTLYSSVANDPSNLSNYYSKQFSVGADNKFYLMPDGALYWYGYMSDECEILSTANGWTYSSGGFLDPVFNTNNVVLTGASSRLCGIASKNKISTSKILSIAKGITAITTYGGLYSYTAKEQSATSSYTLYDSASVKKYELSTGATIYPCTAVGNARSSEVYALWYE